MPCHSSRRDFKLYQYLQVPMDDEGRLRFIVNSHEINPLLGTIGVVGTWYVYDG